MYQTKRQADSSDALLEICARLIAADGLKGASARAIAAQSGQSPSAVNYRFGAHAALVEQSFTRQLEAQSVQTRATALDLLDTLGRSPLDLGILIASLIRADAITMKEMAINRWTCCLEAQRNGRFASIALAWSQSRLDVWESVSQAFGLDPSAARLLACFTDTFGRGYALFDNRPQFDAFSSVISQRLAARLMHSELPAISSRNVMFDLEPATASGTQDSDHPTVIRMLDSAVSIILTDGPEFVTHRAIAERGGVSLSSTTHHFESITEILYRAFAQLFAVASAGYTETSQPGRICTRAELMNWLARDPNPDADRQRQFACAVQALELAALRTPQMQVMAQALFSQRGRTILTMIRNLTDARGPLNRADAAIISHTSLGLLRLDALGPVQKGPAPATQPLASILAPLLF